MTFHRKWALVPRQNNKKLLFFNPEKLKNLCMHLTTFLAGKYMDLGCLHLPRGNFYFLGIIFTTYSVSME
jgi:hypothetical protein